MKYDSQQVALKDINKFTRFRGVYRVIDCDFTDLLEGFWWHVTLCDGKSQVKISTTKNSADFDGTMVGAFVYIDAGKYANYGWRILSSKLISSRLALASQGFTFDGGRFELAQKQSIRELLNEVKSNQLTTLIEVAEATMFEQFKAGVRYDTWLESTAFKFLSEIVCVQFLTDKERDYAIVLGFAYALFIEQVGPLKRFDMTVKEDMTFISLFDEMTQYLARHMPEFGNAFEKVIGKTDPLKGARGLLSDVSYIQVIQIIACQSVECFGVDVHDELKAA